MVKCFLVQTVSHEKKDTTLMQNLYLQKYLVFISVSIVPTTSELRVSRSIIWNNFFQV